MDFSAFSIDSEFDEYNWINSVFKHVSKNEKEAKVEEVVSKLRVYVQESNESIDEILSSIVNNMPILANETKKLRQQAVQLKNKMTELEKDISKTETAFSMANLERLDNLKTKLEAAKNFLEQNDSFSKLTADLEDLLESENTDATVACEKLFALKKSYEAQKNLAGDSDREQKMEEFKNRIEAMLTSLVIKALSDGNVEESQKYVEMFRKIDRLAEIKNYYNTIQRDSFHRYWIEISGSIENSVSENPRFLSDFYEVFLTNWTKSLRWHREVFSSDGVVETVSTIADTLSSLHPSRESVISSYLNRINEKMELLQEVSEANVRFSKSLNEKIVDSGVCIPKEKLSALSHSIFNFFNIFIVKYSSLEQSNLDANFDTLKIMQTSGSESVRCLENSILKVFDWINQVIDRQSAITQDCSIISIIYILNTFFKTKFLEKFKKAQLQLDASRSDQQDWNLLQICISLLQNIGNFKLKLDEIEEKIRKLILAKSKQISNNEEFCYKIVGQRDMSDFLKYVSRLESNEPTQLIIFENLIETIQKVAQDSHEMMLRNVFAPIDTFFRELETSDANSSSTDLPDFSLSPLTYITEIGQQLLLLPQHLEPLLLHPSKPLQLALELSDESYAENVPSADVLLSIIADKTCSVYQHKIKQINSINDGEAKQLATDIEYLESVLEELGLVLSNQLKHITQLLKVKPQNYQTISTGADHKLIAAIRQMRNINISDESPQQ